MAMCPSSTAERRGTQSRGVPREMPGRVFNDIASDRRHTRIETPRDDREVAAHQPVPPVVVDGGGEMREHVAFCVPLAVAATIMPMTVTMPEASNSYVESI